MDLYSIEENTNMKLNLNRLRVISLAAVLGTTAALAQDVAAPPSHGKMMPSKMAGMSDQSAKMTAMHQKMMADMKIMDAKLDLKVTTMNAAQGAAKTDAIADVINEMASQHKQMMANMDNMCKEMMNHMAHPDMPMKGMGMGKAPAGSPK